MTPPYHLRPNKAVDRFMLIETLKRVFKIKPSRDYTYYSLAGPFLEDSKLIYQFFPEIKLVSLEEKREEFKRQRFHRFCKHLRLLETSLKDFLSTYEARGRQIFWIDYTNFKYENVAWFGDLLTKVSDFSVIRITVKCSLEELKSKLVSVDKTDEQEKILEKAKNEFEEQFRSLISYTLKVESLKDELKYRQLIQDLIQVQSQISIPTSTGRIYQVLNTSYYKDTTGMLSITGIVLPIKEINSVLKEFKLWKFANLSWKAPIVIKVPILSVQERLKLQKYLPLNKKIPRNYLKCLGYYIGNSHNQHSKMMENYADFYFYYPFFARINI